MRGERVTLLFTCLTSDLSPHLMGTHTHKHTSPKMDVSVQRRFSVPRCAVSSISASSEGAPSTRPLTLNNTERLRRTHTLTLTHTGRATGRQYIYHFIYRSGNLPMQWPFDRLFVQAPMRHTLLTPSLRTTSPLPSLLILRSSIFLFLLLLTHSLRRCHLSSLAHLLLAIYLIRCGLARPESCVELCLLKQVAYLLSKRGLMLWLMVVAIDLKERASRARASAINHRVTPDRNRTIRLRARPVRVCESMCVCVHRLPIILAVEAEMIAMAVGWPSTTGHK